MTWFRPHLLAVSLTATVTLTAPALAQTQFSAELVGHALIPAATFLPPPPDAPTFFATSGKFAGPGNTRNNALYSIEGSSFLSAEEAPLMTGLFFPFVGQPLQGFSGIKSMGEGEYWVLVDNGFGSKANSADALLQFHRVKPNWDTGRVDILQSVFLQDPDQILPFPITTEGSTSRYLTGADFDIEGMQPVGDQIWFGDEFGPYLFATDLEGRVVEFYETQVDGEGVQSPDHHGLRLPAIPGEVSFRVRRSRGFEGLAASEDGQFLYPLFEAPLWDEEAGDWEQSEGQPFLRMLEFDLEERDFTERQYKYALEDESHAIGDFNMIDESRALVIERDGGEGDIAVACEDEVTADCFSQPAEFKRVYLIDLAQTDEEGFVNKVGYIDLLDIEDPNTVALQGGNNGQFSFPFVTIEDVDIVDADHIIVANDNNLPFSSGRELGRNDDNEFILLKVSDFLAAE